MKFSLKLNLNQALLVCFISALFISGCKKKETTADPAPTACFSYSPRFTAIKQIINFQNCSQNFDRVEWDFGDGNSSTISEPSHAWDHTGAYNVSLTVFKGSKSEKITKKVAIGTSALSVFTVNFLNRNFPQKYTGFYANVYACKTDNISVNYKYMDVYASIQSQLKSYLSLNADEQNSKYRLKIIFNGTYADSSSGAYKDEKIDSLLTDEIDIIDGPKKAIDSVSLKYVKVTFNISTFTYQ